jgi:hypothetical protein
MAASDLSTTNLQQMQEAITSPTPTSADSWHRIRRARPARRRSRADSDTFGRPSVRSTRPAEVPNINSSAITNSDESPPVHHGNPGIRAKVRLPVKFGESTPSGLMPGLPGSKPAGFGSDVERMNPRWRY